jgi:glycosyltransferase involved in cell wall biosynthesis
MLNIVIPIYNEGSGILKTLNQIGKDVHTAYKVYLVYDSEQDSSLPYLKERMISDKKIGLVKNKFGSGGLNAIKTGLLASRDSEACLITMADLSDEYSGVDRMYQYISEGYGIVCASRYMRGGRQVGAPFIKGILSRLAGISLYYLAGIPTYDATNNFKMYSGRLLKEIKIESRSGPEFALELVVKAHFLGYRIKEIPTVWKERTEGKSRFRLLKWLPGYLKWYLWAIKNSMFGRVAKPAEIPVAKLS